MKKALLITMVLALTSGCAVMTSKTYRSTTTTNGVTTVEIVKGKAVSFFDSQDNLTKFRAASGTNGSYIAAQGVNASATNGIATIQALTGLLGALPK